MPGVPKASRNRMESTTVLAPWVSVLGAMDMGVSDMLTRIEHICMFEQINFNMFEHTNNAGLPVSDIH